MQRQTLAVLDYFSCNCILVLSVLSERPHILPILRVSCTDDTVWLSCADYRVGTSQYSNSSGYDADHFLVQIRSANF